ncbi:MAG: site-specific integrase [Bryobacteraceae bacterium]|nr:site-specific integrase [Bryobacteraceae bacterium]
MGVIKRGNSRYWYIQFQLNGRTYIRSSRTTSKKAAEQMETDWRAKLHANQFLGQRPRILIREAMTQFCASKQGTPNHPALLSRLKVVSQRLPAGKPLDELSLHDLERFKRDRQAEGVSTQTIKHNLGFIRCAWKYARKLGYQVAELEFPEVKTPKHKLRYLSEDEERRLLAELDPRREGKGLRRYAQRDDRIKRTMQDAYDLVVVLLDTGARYSEIANIEWSRINLAAREIHLWRSKVQNETVLYMTDRVHRVLSRRAGGSPGRWVFENKAGGPRGYASVAIRKALRRAGLSDCRIHTLRHTHASRLIQNGMSVYEVREILGHTDIQTTMRYAHLERRQVTAKARDVIDQLNRKNGD